MAMTYRIVQDGTKQPFVVIKGSGGEGGTGDYNELSHRPIINVSGNPIVLATLTTNAYKITGSWQFSADEPVEAATPDQIFLVDFNGSTTVATIISAAGLMRVFVDGGNIVYDTAATEASIEEAIQGITIISGGGAAG